MASDIDHRVARMDSSRRNNSVDETRMAVVVGAVQIQTIDHCLCLDFGHALSPCRDLGRNKAGLSRNNFRGMVGIDTCLDLLHTGYLVLGSPGHMKIDRQCFVDGPRWGLAVRCQDHRLSVFLDDDLPRLALGAQVVYLHVPHRHAFEVRSGHASLLGVSGNYLLEAVF